MLINSESSFIRCVQLFSLLYYPVSYSIKRILSSSLLSPVISDIQYTFRRGPVRIQCTQILFVPSYLKYRATQSAEYSNLLSCQKASDYDQKIPQSRTADQHIASLARATDQLQSYFILSSEINAYQIKVISIISEMI